MLTWTSTTSLACSQSPKLFLMRKLIQTLRDALAPEGLGSKTTSWITCALLGEKYGAASPTLRCCTPPFSQWQIIAHTSTFNSKTVPRVTNLCSAAHVAHDGSPWHSLKRCIHRDLNKCVCCVCVYVCHGCVWVTCTYSGVDMHSSVRTYIHWFKRWCRSGTSD